MEATPDVGVPVHSTGGVQRKVNPSAGIVVGVIEQVMVL